MVSMFDSSYIDPFNIKTASEGLVNFSACQQITEEIEIDMTSCIDNGENMFKKFVSGRLETNPDGLDQPVKSFFSPMTRRKVKTMTVNKKKSQVKPTNKINSEIIFQRLLAVNAYKMISTERVFAFENTPVSTSLFHEDGSMLKCKQSDFMSMLEGLIPDKITRTHKADTLIVDEMGLVPSLS